MNWLKNRDAAMARSFQGDEKESAIEFWRDRYFMQDRITIDQFEELVELILKGKMTLLIPRSLRGTIEITN